MSNSPYEETLHLSVSRPKKKFKLRNPLKKQTMETEETNLEEVTLQFRCVLLHLPKEVLYEIFKYLDTRDISRCARTCSLFRETAWSLTQKISLSQFNKRVTDDTLKFISTFSQLRNLNLTDCYRITDKGLHHLSALPNLQKLFLWGCLQITDKGLEYLAKCVRLHTLNLSRCSEITSEGVSHLVTLTALKKLDFYECYKLNDSCLQYLTQLPNLNHLNLSACAISKETTEKLANFSKLDHLFLWRCTNLQDLENPQLHSLKRLREALQFIRLQQLNALQAD